jgi:hypothetical protein
LLSTREEVDWLPVNTLKQCLQKYVVAVKSYEEFLTASGRGDGVFIILIRLIG